MNLLVNYAGNGFICSDILELIVRRYSPGSYTMLLYKRIAEHAESLCCMNVREGNKEIMKLSRIGNR